MSTAVKWGLITGMVYVAFSLVSNLLGLQQGAGGSSSMGLGFLVTSLQFIVTFFTIFLGVKEAKSEDFGGYLTLAQGFKTGLTIAFIASLIAGVFTIVYMQFIDPDMADRILTASEDQMDEMNIPEDRREMSLKWTRYMTNPLILGGFMIVWITFWGLVKGLVAGLILKKDPPVTIPPVEVS